MGSGLSDLNRASTHAKICVWKDKLRKCWSEKFGLKEFIKCSKRAKEFLGKSKNSSALNGSINSVQDFESQQNSRWGQASLENDADIHVKSSAILNFTLR